MCRGILENMVGVGIGVVTVEIRLLVSRKSRTLGSAGKGGSLTVGPTRQVLHGMQVLHDIPA